MALVSQVTGSSLYHPHSITPFLSAGEGERAICCWLWDRRQWQLFEIDLGSPAPKRNVRRGVVGLHDEVGLPRRPHAASTLYALFRTSDVHANFPIRGRALGLSITSKGSRSPDRVWQRPPWHPGRAESLRALGRNLVSTAALHRDHGNVGERHVNDCTSHHLIVCWLACIEETSFLAR